MKGVRGEPMSRHTSWHIGGPAEAYLSVRTTDDFVEALLAARAQAVPAFVLGGGTNILVADAGIRGVVVHDRVNDVKVEGTTVVAAAGVPMAHVASEAARHGIAGLEFAATVPGTVGGAVHGNAGAFGTETKDVLAEVVLFTPEEGIRVVDPAALVFRYRWSALKETGAAVLQATFRGLASERALVVARIKEMANERLAKQPLNKPNCGSVFKNPPGDHAGRLAEAAGAKGLRVGGAVVSERHANFIVNTGDATAADVRALIEEVRRRVLESSGVLLEPEVEFVGDWEDE